MRVLAMNAATICTVITVTVFAFASPGASVDVDPQTVFMMCNKANFPDNSLFAIALSNCTDGLMYSLVPYRTGEYPFLIKSGDTELFMEAYCNRDFGPKECGECFSSILKDINFHCKNSMGVQNQHRDCWLRYESYSFDDIDKKLHFVFINQYAK